MATKKKTEKVETADLTPKVTRARKPKQMFKGWAEVERNGEKKFVCPNCGVELREIQIRQNFNRCFVCGKEAE